MRQWSGMFLERVAVARGLRRAEGRQGQVEPFSKCSNVVSMGEVERVAGGMRQHLHLRIWHRTLRSRIVPVADRASPADTPNDRR